VTRIVEADPEVDPRGGGAVEDLADHDLAVLVEAEVGGRPDLVAERRQRRADAAERRLVATEGEQAGDPVAEDVGAVGEAHHVALEDQGAEQVVGGAELNARLARQQLRRGAVGVVADRLHQVEGTLHRPDQGGCTRLATGLAGRLSHHPHGSHRRCARTIAGITIASTILAHGRHTVISRQPWRLRRMLGPGSTLVYLRMQVSRPRTRRHRGRSRRPLYER
jgi:hypothetical protein